MKLRLGFLCRVALIGSLTLAPLVAADTESAAPLRVVTSIKPLALIARELLPENAEVTVLVPANATPHHYSLKTSDMHRLEEADLVVWLGPTLEQFLTKPMRSLPSSRRLSLGETALAEHPSEAPHLTDHHHHSHSEDLHRWLDPHWAAAVADQLAQRVSELQPARADDVAARLAALQKRYRKLEDELAVKLVPLQHQGFVVYHRGYDALVDLYQLRQLGWITINPDQPPGIKHLMGLEKLLAASQPAVHCLVVDRSHYNSGVDKLAQQLQLTPVSVDLLGASADTSSYPQLMTRLAEQLLACVPDNQ